MSAPALPAPVAAAISTRSNPFVGYSRLLGGLLAGYLFFDRAFAYLHLPGVPIFVAEMVLLVGVFAALRATAPFRRAIAHEPVLLVLAVFMLWGAIRTVPGIPAYGMDALRDAALWYYALFAFLGATAAVVRPDWPLLLLDRLRRMAPALLVWLSISLVAASFSASAPTVPFTDVSFLSHKPGNAGLAALLVLCVFWLLPGDMKPRRRVLWSLLALVVLALVGTQNRGGLLAALAGGAVALTFVRDRAIVVARTAAVVGLVLTLTLLLSLKVPFSGLQGRDYSATQLVTNLVSLTGTQTAGNLGGTVDGRKVLWTRVLHKQVTDGRLLAGAGFGPNLAAEVGVFDAGSQSLRSPHNTHLHVFARVGIFGASLWVLFWAGWYWRMCAGIRRLRAARRHVDRQVAGVCLAFTTAVLVSTSFDPQLEGPQVAALVWTVVGVGLAVSRRRA